MDTGAAARRGGLLLQPVAIAAVLVLILNDHLLKAAFPGFVTGKVSDVAGLVFFPLLLAEVAGWLLARDAARLVPAAAVLSGLAFALVKLTTAGAVAYAWGLGALQWIVSAGLVGRAELRPVAIVMDPTDVVALPALLVACLVARRPPSRPSLIVIWSRLARSRPAPIAIGLLMAAATMATTPAPAPPTGVAVTERIEVASDEIAVRHLTWSVAKPEAPLARVRLEVSTRAGGDANPDSSASPMQYGSGPGIDSFEPLRVVPDDPRLASGVSRDGTESEFTMVTLDLAGTCAAGCTGGARIFVSATRATVVTRLTTGTAHDDPLLSLLADGVGDYTGPIGVADSGEQEAQIELDHVRLAWHGGFTLHVSGSALQAPIGNMRVIFQTRLGGIDDKAGMGAIATLGIGPSSAPIDIGGSARWHIFDVSSLCVAGTPCDIPIRLDVVAGPPSPVYVPGLSPLPSPTPGHGVDIYRWTVRLIVQSFDGRALPADGASISPAQP